MSIKFEQQEFIRNLQIKMGKPGVPRCPYCGGQQFSALDSFATIIINKQLDGINLGPSIPAGMIVCQKCGHIEFFALGALGMLPKKEEQKDEQGTK